MGKEFLYLEHFARRKPLKQKSKGKKGAIISFVLLLIFGMLIVATYLYQTSSTSPEIEDIEYWNTLYNFLFVYSALFGFMLFSGIVFIISLLAYFFGKETVPPEKLGVTADGIILSEREFNWDSIHTISPLWQSMFHQITQRLSPFNPGEGDLYTLQEKSGAFHQILTVNKDLFEQALSKAGAAHLLVVKPKKNQRSNQVAALGVFGFFLAMAGGVTKNPILGLVGVSIIILTFALIFKYKL